MAASDRVERLERSSLDTGGMERLLRATVRQVALLAAWIATCGSLFLSDVLGWQPCLLCWYQRILMYPLALLLAVGILRRDLHLHLYALPFSLPGMAVALYHYLLVKTNWLAAPSCSVNVPCTVDHLNWLGFINVPFLALIAFLIITSMMLMWAAVRPPVGASDCAMGGSGSLRDRARLSAALIIAAVVLAFIAASRFV